MATDFDRGIRNLCSPEIQELYRQFDAACDRHDYDAADAILLKISDINAGSPAVAITHGTNETRH